MIALVTASTRLSQPSTNNAMKMVFQTGSYTIRLTKRQGDWCVANNSEGVADPVGVALITHLVGVGYFTELQEEMVESLAAAHGWTLVYE